MESESIKPYQAPTKIRFVEICIRYGTYCNTYINKYNYIVYIFLNY